MSIRRCIDCGVQILSGDRCSLHQWAPRSHTKGGPFDFLNESRDYERAAFGANWVGPEKFENWKEVLVAIYPCEQKSDGHRVDVYCTAAPARFYRLDVYDWPNSVGEMRPGWEISTGSGAHEIAAHLAREIERGMLGFKPRNRSDDPKTPEKQA